MGTPYSTIFDAYFTRVEDDLYGSMDSEELNQELIQILEAALPRFLYPKVDIEDRDNTEKTFNVELTNAEIQIIAMLMNLIWVETKLHDVEIVRQVYRDHDFQLTSQASHLRGLITLKNDLELQVRRAMHNYSKVVNRRPDFDGLAGG